LHLRKIGAYVVPKTLWVRVRFNEIRPNLASLTITCAKDRRNSVFQNFSCFEATLL